MAPLNIKGVTPTASFKTDYEDVDLTTLSDLWSLTASASPAVRRAPTCSSGRCAAIASTPAAVPSVSRRRMKRC